MFRTQSIPFPLEARQNLIGGKDLLTLAELKIDDPRIMDKPNDYEMSVSFSVGTETISAPMAIFKGEE